MVTHQLQVERRTGKVRRPETTFYHCATPPTGLPLPLSNIKWRLRSYGHVLRKDDDDDWVKKCMEYEVEVSRPRGRPKRTWREVVREDCQARKLNKEDAVDRCKWRKMIKDVR